MEMSVIDIRGMKPVFAKKQAEPDIVFVEISDLIVDLTYQRKIEKRGWKNIQKIAENFDWSKFTPLMVSLRPDGKFAIIDGQHRAHAAALCGKTRVPAMVSKLTVAQEAAAFSWINGVVTALTTGQIFKAALAAEEEWAIKCRDVVRSSGCELMTYNASTAMKRPYQVFAVNMVRSFIEKGLGGTLTAVLKGITYSDIHKDISYYNARTLQVLITAASEVGMTDVKTISDFLNENNILKTELQVRVMKERPEYKKVAFKALYTKSVVALMRRHMDELGLS
jgi:hypothetical protein